MWSAAGAASPWRWRARCGQTRWTSDGRVLPLEAREMAAHEAEFGLARIEAVDRTLGWRSLRSVDAEGQEFGRARLQRAFCHDVPVDATLRRLLQTALRPLASSPPEDAPVYMRAER